MNVFDAAARPDEPALLARRRRNFGAASVLFFEAPLEVMRGEGAWMIAVDGRRYLDCYNNVLSLGHCHPAVAEAVARQSAALTVNSRYLTEGVERYLEALKATLPPALSNAVLVCSGSEANDLALRVAASATGARGVIVTEAAYHGNTSAVADISPSSWRRARAPAHVRIVPAPSPAAFGEDVAGGFAAAVAEAAASLHGAGFGLSALIADTIFSSDGVHSGPAGFLAEAAAAAHAAGGLFIADEVQPGFARTGEAFWGFARHGVEPDIVTMGKPMGNGFPMAGMATRPDLLARYCEEFGFFSTFGANPVAAAAGLAVLDTIALEGLQARAEAQGRRLRARFTEIAAVDGRLVAVRGAGLFFGLELADAGLARRVINGMRERGVLIGAAGRTGETLKARPPLTLTDAEGDLFAGALEAALAAA
ncbi:aminotransferase class III-fold pyridoxal phosphate-dependent enzyme [Rubrimonas cliftonensis]